MIHHKIQNFLKTKNINIYTSSIMSIGFKFFFFLKIRKIINIIIRTKNIITLKIINHVSHDIHIDCCGEGEGVGDGVGISE